MEAVGLPALAYTDDNSAMVQPLPSPDQIILDDEREGKLASEGMRPDVNHLNCSLDDDESAPLASRLQTMIAGLPAVKTQHGPLSWTLANEAYADMFDESWAMLERVGLSGQHFVVCLDRGCATAHCVRRQAHLLLLAEDHLPLTPSPEEHVKPSKPRSGLISAVALAKFQVAAALAHLRYEFIFLEMDVWLRRNPMSLFPPCASKEGGRADLYIGGHCESQF